MLNKNKYNVKVDGETVATIEPDLAEKTDVENFHVVKPKLSLLVLHHEASVKAKAIMGLAVLGAWVPFIPSIIALFLVRPALRETPTNNSTLFLVKWGKRVSWLFVILNTVGLIAIIVIFAIAGDIMAEACLTNDLSYCQFLP